MTMTKGCSTCRYSSCNREHHTSYCFIVGSCDSYDKWQPILGEKKKEDDPVNPQHYKQYAVEVIDLIKQALTPEEFKGYLKGNMLKYRFRAGYKKDREEDLKKSNWYQDKLATD